MSKTPETETETRYQPVSDRKVNHEGRIGYTWRFLPHEAEALDARVAKDGYSDRTSWFREVVLKLPPHERRSAAKEEKPSKKGKKAAKKAAAKPAKAKKVKKAAASAVTPSKADIQAQPEA